jgi:hypothetical protein
MRYPKSHLPESHWEHLSMLHSQLSAAYSIIAQYENEERDREREKMMDTFRSHKPKRNFGPSVPRPDVQAEPFKTQGGEDDSQTRC